MSLFTVKREVFEHYFFEGEEYSKREAWLWLISEASYDGEQKKRINGKTVILKRGTLSHSVRYLAEKWRWSKSKVARFLKELENEGMLKIGTVCGTAGGTAQSLITLCNYDEHTPAPKKDGTANGTQNGTEVGQERDNIKEVRGYSYVDGLSARAHEGGDAKTVFAETSKAINAILMPITATPVDTTLVHSWLNAGADPQLDIIPTIQRIAASAKRPPRSLRYFHDAVLEAAAIRKQTPKLPEVKHDRSNKHTGFGEIDYGASADEFNRR